MIELPREFMSALDALSRRVLGSNDAVGDALAERVAALSALYTRDRTEVTSRSADPSLLAARLRFFLPRDAPKVALPLAEVHAAGGLPERETLRVLDLGAGVGASTVGVALFATEREAATRLEVTAVEGEAEALAVYAEVAAASERLGLVPVDVDSRRGDLRDRSMRSGGPYDVAVVALALNEHLEDAEGTAALLERIAEDLAPGGTLLVVEPALREETRRLHRARDAVVSRGALTVFAPCLHQAPCPMLERPRDWCHEDRPFRLPEPLPAIARTAGLRYERSTYAYLTLRKDGRSLRDGLDGAGAPYRVVAQPQVSKGKRELWGCGANGHIDVLMRLDRHATPDNAAWTEARRGDVVAVEGAEAKGARLRVRGDTKVRLATAQGTDLPIEPPN